ncbi:MAG: hypothetical protein KC503_29150 [Myxococcales bacterium]|nr:hypothetical protein [Myxococcales bacterium]
MSNEATARPSGELLRLLMIEIDRWTHAGLINRFTRERLRRLYDLRDADALHVPAPQRAMAPLPALLEGPPTRDELEASLEREVAKHEALAAAVEAQHHALCAERASLTALPVAERAQAASQAQVLGAAASAASSALADAARVTPEAPADALAREESGWPTVVKRFLGENALWLFGGLLVTFGSIYFLQAMWQQLARHWLYGLIALGLHGYAAAFFGAGLALARKREAHGVARVLFCFTSALLPLAAVASGELVALLWARGGATGVAGAAITALLTLAAQGAMVAVISGLFERKTMGAALAAALPLALAISITAALGARALWVVPAAVLAIDIAMRRLSRDGAVWQTSLLYVVASAVWALFVVVGRVHVAVGGADVTLHALWLAPLCASLLATDRRLRARAGAEPRLSGLGLALHGASLVAVALAIVGLATRGYFNTLGRVALLVAAAGATWGFARRAADSGRSLATYLAASCGVLTYYFLPAPFSGLVHYVSQRLGPALGYVNEPLPPAYFGIALLPYVIFLGMAARRLAARTRDDARGGFADIARDLERFVMVIGATLAALALTAGDDARPMFASWPIYAALAHLLARVSERRWLHGAAHALTIGLVAQLGLRAAASGWFPLGAPLLLAALALVLALLAPRLIKALPVEGAIGALAAAVIIGAYAPWNHTPLQLALAFTLAALALARIAEQTRWRAPAHLAALALLVAAPLGAVALMPGHVSDFVSLSAVGGAWLLLAAVASALVHRFRLAFARDVQRLVVEPARTLGIAASALPLLLGVVALGEAAGVMHVYIALAAVLLIHQGLSSRGFFSLFIPALGVMLALASLASGVPFDALDTVAAMQRWVPVVGAMMVLLLLARRRVPLLVPGADRVRRRAALAAASGCAVLGFAIGGVVLGGLGWLALVFFGLAAAAAVLVFEESDALGQLSVVVVGLALLTGATLLIWRAFGTSGAGWHQVTLMAALAAAWTLVSRIQPFGDARRKAADALALLHLTVPLAALVCVHAAQVLFRAPSTLLALARAQIAWPLHLAAATTLAASLLLARGRPATRAYAFIAAVAGAFGVVMAVAPSLPVSLVLGLIAVAAAAATSRGVALVSARPLASPALGVLFVGVMALRLAPPAGEPALLAALGALVFMLVARRRAGRDEYAAALGVAWSAAAAVTTTLGTLWVAQKLSTGAYPRATVLSLLAPPLLLCAAALRAVAARVLRGDDIASEAERHAVRTVGGFVITIAGISAAAAPLFAHGLPGFAVALTLASLVAVALWQGAICLREQRESAMYVAMLAVLGAYVWARQLTALSALPFAADIALAFVVGQLLILRRVANDAPEDDDELRHVRRPLWLGAALLPLALIPAAPDLQPSSISLAMLVGSLYYAVLAARTRSRLLRVPALAAGNIALFAAWAALGWTDVLLYAVPIAASLLLMIQTYRAELGSAEATTLRSIVVVVVHGIALGQALTSASALQGLVIVPLLALACVVFGVVLRVRVYVLLGSCALLADLLLNMVRYGLQSRALGALFLTALGLLVVGAMVVFSLERERILRRYSAILAELRTWD